MLALFSRHVNVAISLRHIFRSSEMEEMLMRMDMRANKKGINI